MTLLTVAVILHLSSWTDLTFLQCLFIVLLIYYTLLKIRQFCSVVVNRLSSTVDLGSGDSDFTLLFQGSHTSWKVLDFPPKIPRTWRDVENEFGPGN